VRADARQGERERPLARGPTPAVHLSLRFEWTKHPEIDPERELLAVSAAPPFEGISSFPSVGATAPRDVELELLRAEELGPDRRKIS
jgi:hypothetical protein